MRLVDVKAANCLLENTAKSSVKNTAKSSVKSTVKDSWLATLANQQSKHIVLGYGSLLSRDSRERHSGIYTQGLPVRVSGFKRAWVTRSLQEKQTYVGAVADKTSQLNAQLIPAEVNPSLRAREKNYRFVEVPVSAIEHVSSSLCNQSSFTPALREALSQHQLWLCETLLCHHASTDFPVSQSYIDTCLVGCLEHGGVSEANAFIEHTHGWEHPRINDRANPIYPRAAAISKQHLAQIDTLLNKAKQSTQRHTHSCCY
ncbi:gamma-glutamylcyclotransferase [Alteromonas sp. MMG017]|uniref:gamma-glutamylcyclotransferase family protein n=1 Tax=Alteromonas sp. MMG017 TaxID=2822692 RepID=UPI001B39FF11|nr:gamma-glutamylcyclotransferase [Alteromonas sp. MMG017]